MESTVSYENPIPVVVCIIPVLDRNGFLGQRRAIAPKIGEVAFPGGYVDKGETAEIAASREVLQETGQTISEASWKIHSTRITPDNKLLIFMVTTQAVDARVIAEFQPNNEVSELAVIHKDTRLAFPLHQDVLEEVFNQNANLSSSTTQTQMFHRFIGVMFVWGGLLQYLLGYSSYLQNFGISETVFYWLTSAELFIGGTLLASSFFRLGKSSSQN